METIRPLSIKLFNGFCLRIGEGHLASFEPTRMIKLLAYLLLNRGQPISRSRLAFIFWPDSNEKQAHANLRNLLYYLRRNLPHYDRFITVDHLTIEWRMDAPYWLDVAAFEDHLGQAGEATLFSQKLNHYEAAVKLYQGELLPGHYSDWLLVDRQRLAHAYEAALGELVSLYESTRDYQDAIRHARDLIHHDPLQESPYLQMMRLQALIGDNAAALHTYHSYATLLRREMGVEPGQPLRELYDRLTKHEPVSEDQSQLLMAVPLVGREKSWQLLRQTWRRATHQPKLVLIEAEAGIGKTHLAEAFVDWIKRQGIPVLSGRCYPTEDELAYAPIISWLRGRPLPDLQDHWLEALMPLLPEIGGDHPELLEPELIGKEWQRVHLFNAIASAILLGQKSLLIFLDDLQWCDKETLDWLIYLMTAQGDETPIPRLMVMVGLRSEGGEAYANLKDWQATLLRADRLVTLRLGPLNQADTLALASHVSGRSLDSELGPTLYQTTEGHPFFIVELIRSAQPLSSDGISAMHLLATTLPSRVRQVLEARLAQLSSLSREVIAFASVIGRDFSYSILERVSRLSEDELVGCLDECWRPLGAPTGGNGVEYFTGSYDGGGYVMKNLTINPVDQDDSPAGHLYFALFGYVDRAILKNIFLKNIDIRATRYSGSWFVGGLAGRADNSILDNVHVIGEGNVIHALHDGTGPTDLSSIGGLVGMHNRTDVGLEESGLIHNASSNATVHGERTSNVGGLVGVNYGIIRHSHSTGEVIGANSVGGLVGHNNSVITDSYSRAIVSGVNQVGGFAGGSLHTSGVAIHRSYSTGRVSGDEDVGGFMGEASLIGSYSNCYWDIQTSQKSISAGGSGVLGLTTEEMQMEKSYRYFNFNTLWQIDEEMDYPDFQDLAAYGLPQPINLSDLTGSGTEDDPYIITNADELNAMRQELTASYQLGSDIDLSASVAWNNGRGWMEVGRSGSDEQFTGSFDGAGFTIENLTMNRPRQRPVNYFQGLFGYTNDAAFKDVHFENTNIHCYDTCGTLAGFLSGGSVENVSVNGVVYANYNDVGGVIGRCQYGTSLQNIFTEVDVHGRHNTGGIAGNMDGGVLFSANVMGSVQGAYRVGGLAGRLRYSTSLISESYNRASVSGYDEVGGLVGLLDAGVIDQSFSSGPVSGTGDHVGGLVGRNTSLDTASTAESDGASVRADGNVTASYWDTETSSQETSAGGIGRTTEEMVYPYATNTYVGWDFLNTWGADSAYLYNAGYPYLRAAVSVDPVPVDFDIYLPLIIR